MIQKTAFKKNDRVKYVSGKYGDGPDNPLWGGPQGNIVGTITETNNFGGYAVRWDNNTHNSYNTDYPHLEFAIGDWDL